MMQTLEKSITKATFLSNRILISSNITSIYLRGKNFLLVNDFAEKQFRHLKHTLFIVKSKISFTEKFPSLLVNKLFFFSSKYIKPVKGACNSIMLQTNLSSFEKTLSKNSPRSSNECFTRRENPKNTVLYFHNIARDTLKQRKFILKIFRRDV